MSFRQFLCSCFRFSCCIWRRCTCVCGQTSAMELLRLSSITQKTGRGTAASRGGAGKVSCTFNLAQSKKGQPFCRFSEKMNRQICSPTFLTVRKKRQDFRWCMLYSFTLKALIQRFATLASRFKSNAKSAQTTRSGRHTRGPTAASTDAIRNGIVIRTKVSSPMSVNFNQLYID